MILSNGQVLPTIFERSFSNNVPQGYSIVLKSFVQSLEVLPQQVQVLEAQSFFRIEVILNNGQILLIVLKDHFPIMFHRVF